MLRCWIFTATGALKRKQDFETRRACFIFAGRTVSKGDFFLIYPDTMPLDLIVADNPGAFGDDRSNAAVLRLAQLDRSLRGARGYGRIATIGV